MMGNKGSSHASTLSRGQGAMSDIRDALPALPGSGPKNKTGRYCFRSQFYNSLIICPVQDLVVNHWQLLNVDTSDCVNL